MKARFAAISGEPIEGTPAQFGRLIADETGKWAMAVKFAGLKVEVLGQRLDGGRAGFAIECSRHDVGCADAEEGSHRPRRVGRHRGANRKSVV